MLEYVENELYNIGINAYPNKNNQFLKCSFSRDNYECVYELCAGKNVQVSVISDFGELKRFLSMESENSQCEAPTRFYRGQRNAAWKCRSSLLREFHCHWEGLFENSAFGSWDEQSEFRNFLEKNYALWLRFPDKQVHRSDICRIFHDERIGNRFKCREYIRELEERLNDVKKLIRAREGKYEMRNRQWIEVAAQHYGMPTPLMDFTTCLDVALYFAVCDDGFYPYYRDLDAYDCINSYICIYQFDVNDEVYDWERHRSESLDSPRSAIPQPGFCEACREWDQQDCSLELLEGTHLYYIANTGKRDIENLRSCGQSGVLLCLASYSHYALEEFASSFGIPNFKKTLIHKSLTPDIQKHLAAKNINKEKLGF